MLPYSRPIAGKLVNNMSWRHFFFLCAGGLVLAATWQDNDFGLFFSLFSSVQPSGTWVQGHHV